jgi:uncharacterized protein YoxC
MWQRLRPFAAVALLAAALLISLLAWLKDHRKLSQRLDRNEATIKDYSFEVHNLAHIADELQRKISDPQQNDQKSQSH